jgi:glycosyltransferase involved in cell wall biosynthesis
MKIIYITPILEYPSAGGPQLRVENSIKALNNISELYVVSRSTEQITGGRVAVNHFKNISHNFLIAPSVSKLSYNSYFRKIQRSFRSIAQSSVERDAEYIINLAKSHAINVLWFSFGNISFDLIKQVGKINPKLKIICDTDSVWSRFILREIPYEKDPKRLRSIIKEGKNKQKEEAEWVNTCQITTAVSEIDAKYYRNLASDKSKIKLFSNVIDIDSYSNIPIPPIGLKTPNIYLAGSFGPKSAMDKAARWFIADVLPLIEDEIPNVHFYIIGNNSKKTLKDINRDNISIMGKVPSVLDFLGNSDVSIVPLQFESGTRFKIMEAAVCNIPVVSTTLGAEGIPVQHERDILIADSEQDFAREVVRVIRDKELAAKISRNCYNLISTNNSVERLMLEAKEILMGLGE